MDPALLIVSVLGAIAALTTLGVGVAAARQRRAALRFRDEQQGHEEALRALDRAYSELAMAMEIERRGQAAGLRAVAAAGQPTTPSGEWQAQVVDEIGESAEQSEQKLLRLQPDEVDIAVAVWVLLTDPDGRRVNPRTYERAVRLFTDEVNGQPVQS